MIKIDDVQTAYFDVDDTLVMWGQSIENSSLLIKIEHPGYTEWLLPHYEHIERLKRHKARGHQVVVWSQGGSDWAEAVVKALHIEPYVDVVVTKPAVYYDDVDSVAFMGKPLYFKQVL